MRIIIVGPGRAGLSLAFAAHEAGHRIVGMVGRDRAQAEPSAAPFDAEALVTGDRLPPADLLLICTRDADIEAVAAALAPGAGAVDAAAHVSGLTPVSALDELGRTGLATGSFHPLQTLPTPQAGAAHLTGAWIAVTAPSPLRETLAELAESLGAHPFDLTDASKPLYHAAAAAAANMPVAALAMAEELFAGAGVPFAAARPLVEAAVANAFELGPRPSLTGPVARGDLATVAAQLEAVAVAAPQWLPDFVATVRAIARLSGRTEELEVVLDPHQRGEREAS